MKSKFYSWLIAGILICGPAIWGADYFLLRSNYSYNVWRVTHPFGPDTAVFQQLAEHTTVKQIPLLIQQMNQADHWWTNELLLAWFGSRIDGAALQQSKNHQEFWEHWWNSNHDDIKELHLGWDPAF